MSTLKIPADDLPKFRRRLLSWFTKRQRDLPWRRTKDSYRIWLSEIMLQQTRVAAVIPYYESFLENFPDVHALAGAPIDQVLKNWAGLGYYSRAKNLQSAAKEIVARHSGEFPRDHKSALDLPGIGRYTAAAVLSIAYGVPHAVLDGNVARVLARLFAVRGDLRAPATWRELETAAQELLAQKFPGDWNQAMMELGATVCAPKSPRCDECPVENWCRARKLGLQEKVPEVRKKRAPVDVTLAAAVLLDPRGQTFLIRETGGDGALFSRMWQFPALQTEGRDSRRAMETYLKEKFHLTTNGNLAALATARHTVTFRNIRLEPFLVRVPKLPRIEDVTVVALAEVPSLSISNATRKIASAAIAQLEFK